MLLDSNDAIFFLYKIIAVSSVELAIVAEEILSRFWLVFFGCFFFANCNSFLDKIDVTFKPTNRKQNGFRMLKEHFTFCVELVFKIGWGQGSVQVYFSKCLQFLEAQNMLCNRNFDNFNKSENFSLVFFLKGEEHVQLRLGAQSRGPNWSKLDSLCR